MITSVIGSSGVLCKQHLFSSLPLSLTQLQGSAQEVKRNCTSLAGNDVRPCWAALDIYVFISWISKFDIYVVPHKDDNSHKWGELFCKVSRVYQSGRSVSRSRWRIAIELIFAFDFHPQVSWIRKRDLHILTIGSITYTADRRFAFFNEFAWSKWVPPHPHEHHHPHTHHHHPHHPYQKWANNSVFEYYSITWGRILVFVFVFRWLFETKYYLYSYSSDFLKPNIIRIRIQVIFQTEYYLCSYSGHFLKLNTVGNLFWIL